ncbi:AAA family ATPase [Halalkalibacterium halodurans]|uniref:ATPase n=1 Tax=Halalkalibacterium halodurans TaxID=86665 RepID=A0A0M0KI60_ALKHA|nr:AAA family ATPase [Halalkalibacterium halodurans]TPE68001.1 ATPase [Halalkalibacterium halodurans]
MNIRFKELSLKNFKSHRDLAVEFGDLTKISGDNAKGKSSIIESIAWLLYGNDTTGSKLDPTPVTYDAPETLVSLLLTIDGTDVLLGRELKKGKAKYYINEVPSKATEFNEIVDKLGSKEFFLSLFNPGYFFSMHWEKQRAMLLQYVTPPSNKEVLKDLPDIQADKLSDLIKKHTLDDLQKIHRENKTKMDKAHIAAESRTKTLREQLDGLQLGETAIEEVQKEYDEIGDQIAEIEKAIEGANHTNGEYNRKKAELDTIQSRIEDSKANWLPLKEQTIQEKCTACGQELKEESKVIAQQSLEAKKKEYKANHKRLVDAKNKLVEELATLQFVDVSEEHQKIRELEDKRYPLLDVIKQHKQHEQLLSQVKEAETDEQEKLKSLNESVFVLDAIKAFRAKEAELQGEKVQKLFTTLSVRLFEQQKNGDIKPTFTIQMDGKDYNKLSLSESIKAGLELREVLSEQAEVIAPCFVDNAESITQFKGPSGQLIMARVVEGQELTIKGE